MIGTAISHYQILSTLGKGGMGEVFLAEDTALGRKVALKFLPESLEQDDAARRRFLREAKSAAAIDHPYTCKIYEVAEADGKGFIAMEYIEGETLGQILQQGPLDSKTTTRYACEIAEALEKAHEKGIVHRDLKPANVMVTVDDHVKVMDFGLAKPLFPEVEADGQEVTLTALTQFGFALGTPPYMSPEQIRGREVDHRSDIFSFGVLVYELLTGTSPFLRPTRGEIPAAILTEEVPPLEAANSTETLRQVIDRSLAKDPVDRYQSFGDLLADLRSDAPARRSPSLKIVAALVIGVFTLVPFFFLVRGLLQGEPKSAPADVTSLQAADHESHARALMQGFSNPQDLELALESWQKVLDLRPDYAPGLAGLATTRVLIVWNSSPEPNLLETAEQEARQAIDLDPQHPDSYAALSIVYLLQGLLDTAEEMSNRSIELAPDNPWVLQTRARFLMERFGDFATAERVARRATEIDPRHHPAWFQLGWAQFELEQPSEAESSFLQAISLQPDFGAGYMGLGTVLLGSGKFDEARLSLEKALQIDPDATMAQYLLGAAFHYLGEPQRALDAYRMLVASNPSHPLAAHARLEQAVQYQALDDPAAQTEALLAAERAFKLIPGLWINMKGLGGVAAVRGESEQALDWLRQARLAGLHSVHQLLMEPALDSLKGNAQFLEIVEEIRQARGPAHKPS